MTSKDASLYGVRPAKRNEGKEISSSTTLAFTSTLSSLISKTSDNSASSRTSAGRSRPATKTKDDIFSTHNRGAKKRALADLTAQDDEDGRAKEQVHQQNIGGVDSATLHRSKRKMEEKARLYAAMKRGDYVPPDGDASRDERERALVDFDRKWAEGKAGGTRNAVDRESSDDDDDSDDGGEEEMVEYEDEFGRLRKGTRAEVAREERKRKGAAFAAVEADSFSARPAQPKNIIYGDTIQAEAFNPDADTTAAMEEIAKKRDRSATPPEEVHYDAGGEVRSKGVGFFQFSRDEETRKKEMAALERERVDTERRRKEQVERKEKRKRDIEERRRLIGEKKAGKLADSFLGGLDLDFGKGESGQDKS